MKLHPRYNILKTHITCNTVGYMLWLNFYPRFKFSFLFVLCMVMYDSVSETEESKILTKDKIEPQHIYLRVEFNLIRIQRLLHEGKP